MKTVQLAAMAAVFLLATPVAAANIVVGSAPLVHPGGGQDYGQLQLAFPSDWWGSTHSGTLEGSGFTWTYDPVAFGEGFSRTFEVQNVARANMTKVLTLSLTVRAPFMPPIGREYCPELRNCSNANNGDFWGNTFVVHEFPYPFLLVGASNIGQDGETGLWHGQFQFKVRPQPAAEYVTFERSDWGATVNDIVSMTLQISCVPEPSAWTSLILGFGVVGGAARRRRALGADVQGASQ